LTRKIAELSREGWQAYASLPALHEASLVVDALYGPQATKPKSFNAAFMACWAGDSALLLIDSTQPDGRYAKSYVRLTHPSDINENEPPATACDAVSFRKAASAESASETCKLVLTQYGLLIVIEREGGTVHHMMAAPVGLRSVRTAPHEPSIASANSHGLTAAIQRPDGSEQRDVDGGGVDYGRSPDAPTPTPIPGGTQR
jgi:hypothetical protein